MNCGLSYGCTADHVSFLGYDDNCGIVIDRTVSIEKAGGVLTCILQSGLCHPWSALSAMDYRVVRFIIYRYSSRAFGVRRLIQGRMSAAI